MKLQSTSAESEQAETLTLRADELAGDIVSFIRISDSSKIELLARKGSDGTAKVALGTCQSCNGAPGAYYSQEGDHLQCNNCKLTFPIDVIDAPGRHPSHQASCMVRSGK